MIQRLNLQPEDFFLTREGTRDKFKDLMEWTDRFPVLGTPIYHEFLVGKRELECSAWAIPTRNIAGWRGPCYFMAGAGHFPTYEEMLKQCRLEQVRRRAGHGQGARPALRQLHDTVRLRAERRVEQPAGRQLEKFHLQLPAPPQAHGQGRRRSTRTTASPPAGGISPAIRSRKRRSHRCCRKRRRRKYLAAARLEKAWPRSGAGVITPRPGPAARPLFNDSECLKSSVFPRPTAGWRSTVRSPGLTTRNCNARSAGAQDNLLRLQSPEGYWVGELMVDSTLCSDFVLYMHWRGKVDPVLQEKCVRHIRRRQLPDGGWNIYHGGPSEINACVKAYFALKLAGHSPQAPWMCEARATILRLGGIPRCNTFSKLYLALMGVFPVEIPAHHPGGVGPAARLALFQHLPDVELDAGDDDAAGDHQPFQAHAHPARGQATPRVVPVRAGRRRFLAAAQWTVSLRGATSSCGATAALKWVDGLGWRPLRARALKEAEAWMVERMGEGSDGLAAIFPAMLNALIASGSARLRGHAPRFPEGAKGFRGFVRR